MHGIFSRVGRALVVLVAGYGCHRPAPVTDAAGSAKPLATGEPEAAAVPNVMDAAPASTVETERDAALPELSPLTGERVEMLRSGGKRIGYVALPLGATTPRPLLVVAHGAGDRGDWEAEAWSKVFDPAIGAPSMFIVCPEGELADEIPGRIPPKPPPGTLTWKNTAHLASAIEAAVKATKARHGPYVLDAPRVFAGFSLGAMLGATIVKNAPATYPYAVFFEGLGRLERVTFAEPFHKGGGQRVLLVCAHTGCAKEYEEVARGIAAGGVEVRARDAGDVGHAVNAKVQSAIQSELPWLLQDARGELSFRAPH